MIGVVPPSWCREVDPVDSILVRLPINRVYSSRVVVP